MVRICLINNYTCLYILGARRVLLTCYLPFSILHSFYIKTNVGEPQFVTEVPAQVNMFDFSAGKCNIQ